MNAAAIAALALVAAGWFAIRWCEESQRTDDLIALILSVDLDTDGRAGS